MVIKNSQSSFLTNLIEINHQTISFSVRTRYLELFSLIYLQINRNENWRLVAPYKTVTKTQLWAYKVQSLYSRQSLTEPSRSWNRSRQLTEMVPLMLPNFKRVQYLMTKIGKRTRLDWLKSSWTLTRAFCPLKNPITETKLLLWQTIKARTSPGQQRPQRVWSPQGG